MTVSARGFGSVTPAMTEPRFPEPSRPAASRGAVFLGYLDYFRERVVGKVCDLPAAEQHRSRLPSGWTPVELLKHLRFVELRWIEWRFHDRDLDAPWGDQRDGRWHVPAEETLEDLVAALRAQGAHTRSVVESTDLDTPARPGEHWPDDPPPLERVLFHLLQEYARHLGQLDIVTELAGGPIGE